MASCANFIATFNKLLLFNIEKCVFHVKLLLFVNPALIKFESLSKKKTL